MKQDTIKIQLLNDTKLCVRLVLPDGNPIPDISEFSLKSVRWGIHGHETESVTGAEVKDGYVQIPISHTMPLGVYDVHILGSFGQLQDEREVSDNRHAMFELVKYGNGISYENYYTDMVIIGLPDSYVEALRQELEKKIEDAEAAKADFEKRIEDLDDIAKESTLNEVKEAVDNIHIDIPEDLARKGDIDAAKTSIKEDINYLTKISTDAKDNSQAAKMASETLLSISDMFNQKLDTIIANTSLTAAQADEDWQNVKPA